MNATGLEIGRARQDSDYSSAMRWFSVRGSFVIFSLAVVLGCAVFSVAWSFRWPLVGDASLMHYVIFLGGRGLIPYRDIVDINLPGTYLFEWLGMRLLGDGAVAWRMYDLLLLSASGAAMVLLAGRGFRAAGALAAGMFALIHIQDGLAQAGQRDLLIAALLLWAYVALFAAQRQARHRAWLVFLCTLLVGVTLTIKPTYLPLGVVLLLLAAGSNQKGTFGNAQYWFTGFAGLSLPWAICVLWLTRIGALPAFVQIGRGLIPLHAELGRRPLAYLLNHAPAPVMFLCAVWLVLWIAHRPTWNRERWELLAGIVIALAAYIAQGKGYPYHRYPLLALLLVVVELDICACWKQDRPPILVLAGVALAFQCVYLAPYAAWQVHSLIQRNTPFEDALSAELRAFGPQLSGNVQCLDTFGGCVNTLYDLRLMQASGYLYDCYLFTKVNNDEVARYRRSFLQAYDRHPPAVLVLTDQYCFGEKGGFDRVSQWPAFAEEMAAHYTLQMEWGTTVPQHWFSRSEPVPRFRIYLRDRVTGIADRKTLRR